MQAEQFHDQDSASGESCRSFKDFVGEFGKAPRKRESLGRGSPRDKRQSTRLAFDSRPSFTFLYILYIRRVYSRFSLAPLFPFFTSVVLSCHIISSLCRRSHEPNHDKTDLSQLSRDLEHAILSNLSLGHSVGYSHQQSCLVRVGTNAQQAAFSQFDASYQSHGQQHHPLRAQCRLAHTVPTPLGPSVHPARCCCALDWSPRCRTQESTHRTLHSGWAHEERCPSLNHPDRRCQRTRDGCQRHRSQATEGAGRSRLRMG
jgi:hypothetical protein